MRKSVNFLKHLPKNCAGELRGSTTKEDKRREARNTIGGYFVHSGVVVFCLVLAAAGISSALKSPARSPERASAAPGKRASVPNGSRTLTFAQRVVYQRTIEGVYWQHRIWPKDRPDFKPSLDEVMPQAQLENKVTDYLRDSQALEDSTGPITAEQLQAEMDRMAKNTKQPEVLREVFEALGNDPFVIAECLARPVLSERSKLASVQSRNGSLNSRVGAQNQMPRLLVAAGGGYTLPAVLNGPNGCSDDTWTATTTNNAAGIRAQHTAVWTGSEMIVWGGYEFGNFLNSGGRYNAITDSWTLTSATNAPSPRALHTAVWTGTEMIVWGGYFYDGSDHYFNTGGKYNPSTDSWTAITTMNAPSPRDLHTAIWTGSEMIVWGGYTGFGGVANTGGRYNPNTDSWAATATNDAPSARSAHTAVWAENEMIVWGGGPVSGPLNTGGRYNAGTDSWTATSTNNVPAARLYHTAVWTGSEMIVWGGTDVDYLNTGGRYNPSSNSWTATSATNVPAARYYHTAIWTGSEMIVWGGEAANARLNRGGRYNPGTDRWTATSTTNAPDAREVHTAVWTGSEMIVWGGYNPPGFFDTGGRYCAQLPAPTATPMSRATPAPRVRPTPAPRP